jgi:L-ribulose-5-phosphate 3-epimerase
MTICNRRVFAGVTAGAGAAAVLGVRGAEAAALRLGIIIAPGKDPDAAVRRVKELGFAACQILMNSFGPELAAPLRSALERHAIDATALVAVGAGPEQYDFYNGPSTIGFAASKYRQARIAQLKQASDFAKSAGIPAVQRHCGFIPENPNDPDYEATIRAIREAAAYCRENGQRFRAETGQETPITLVRAIRDIGLDNMGVNLDPANLLMYGKANPVDALEILGQYIEGVHAKDGLYPTDPKRLGREVQIGQGKVDFPRLIHGLKRIGYSGAITIEREISGPKQIEDVLAAKKYLERLIGGRGE